MPIFASGLVLPSSIDTRGTKTLRPLAADEAREWFVCADPRLACGEVERDMALAGMLEGTAAEEPDILTTPPKGGAQAERVSTAEVAAEVSSLSASTDLRCSGVAAAVFAAAVLPLRPVTVLAGVRRTSRTSVSPEVR